MRRKRKQRKVKMKSRSQKKAGDINSSRDMNRGNNMIVEEADMVEVVDINREAEAAEAVIKVIKVEIPDLNTLRSR